MERWDLDYMLLNSQEIMCVMLFMDNEKIH